MLDSCVCMCAHAHICICVFIYFYFLIVQEKAKTMLDNMSKLEKELFKEMESILQNKHLDVDKIVNLFPQCTKDEIRIYKPNISS